MQVVEKMRGEVWTELEVDLSADDMWAVYSSPDFPRDLAELLPTYFQRINFIEGDGAQGTVLRVTLQPCNPGPQVWYEQFVLVDDTTRTKVVRQISEGYLDLGFNLYETINQIIPRGANACTFKSTVSFDVNEGSESNASTITADWGFAMAVRDYAIQQKCSLSKPMDRKIHI